MSDRHVFVDTNILIYAHDKDAGAKHKRAKQLVSELWERNLPPSVSAQVLQECYVNLVRLGASATVAAEIVSDYMQWDVIPNDAPLLAEGMAGSQRWKISLWDALIIAAAKRASAPALWSEDLIAGQRYDGVVVINPVT